MKILIVEDNMILCGMIEKWLQKAGYEVLTAMDEPGARSILKKNEINLVLGDVRLPEGNGISLLEWMMRSNVEVPFIVMTDYACITDAVRAIKLGAKDYLQKPVHQEQLIVRYYCFVWMFPKNGIDHLPCCNTVILCKRSPSIMSCSNPDTWM